MATGDTNAIEVVVVSARPDLGLVDALARLHLMARRRGCPMVVRPSAELRELLLFVGLGEVLALESIRQAEEGVQLGVQEVVQPGDAAV